MVRPESLGEFADCVRHICSVCTLGAVVDTGGAWVMYTNYSMLCASDTDDSHVCTID